MRPDISGHGEEISPFTSIVQSFYWVVITAVRVCAVCGCERVTSGSLCVVLRADDCGIR